MTLERRRFTSRRATNKEVLRPTSQGVAGFFVYNGRQYGVRLLAEDGCKFEAAITSTGAVEYGYLREKCVGLVGGKVERREAPEAALVRELTNELAESLQISPQEVATHILPHLAWGTPELVEDFTVVQARQAQPQGENIPRAAFEVFLTGIDLTTQSFQELQAVLVPLLAQDTAQLRPFVAALAARGYFSEGK